MSEGTRRRIYIAVALISAAIFSFMAGRNSVLQPKTIYGISGYGNKGWCSAHPVWVQRGDGICYAEDDPESKEGAGERTASDFAPCCRKCGAKCDLWKAYGDTYWKCPRCGEERKLYDIH